MLKKFAELTHVNRCEPTVEFPGTWLVYYRGTELNFASTFDAARILAEMVMRRWEEEKREYDPRDISIAWKCSDSDPRQGKIWFTGYYRAGSFNAWGQYRAY